MDGTWVIVELKHGAVGSGTIAQALHYLLEITKLSDLELVQLIRAKGGPIGAVSDDLERLARSSGSDSARRDYRLVVAGVGDGEAAQEAAQSLANLNLAVDVQVVTFELVVDAEGRRTLIREIEEEPAPTAVIGAQWTLDTVLADADAVGVRAGFEKVIELFESRAGWRRYLKKSGLNFNRGTRKQAFWVRPETGGKIHIGYLDANFPELFGIEEARAGELLGSNWLDLEPSEALAKLERWLDLIDEDAASHALPDPS